MNSEKKNGPQFYDTDHVLETYLNHRSRAENPNLTIEQPILWQLIGHPSGLKILDLGCGDARVAPKFHELGAKSYLGIEGSKKMVEKAQSNLRENFSNALHGGLEEFQPNDTQYDLVISSLVFHYIEDIDALFQKINHCLKPGARLIFSVEHPVITSCNKSLDGTSVRQDWIVDNYFERGAREVRWMGDTVTKYHRTVGDYIRTLQDSGFTLIELRESDPPREFFSDETLWKRRRRIPLFLFLSATKKSNTGQER